LDKNHITSQTMGDPIYIVATKVDTFFYLKHISVLGVDRGTVREAQVTLGRECYCIAMVTDHNFQKRSTLDLNN
jgi:hypothetical protein